MRPGRMIAIYWSAASMLVENAVATSVATNAAVECAAEISGPIRRSRMPAFFYNTASKYELTNGRKMIQSEICTSWNETVEMKDDQGLTKES